MILYPPSTEENKDKRVALVAANRIEGSPAANPLEFPATEIRSTTPHIVPATVDTFSGSSTLGTANESDSPARTSSANTEAVNKGNDASRAAVAVALQEGVVVEVSVRAAVSDQVGEAAILL